MGKGFAFNRTLTPILAVRKVHVADQAPATLPEPRILCASLQNAISPFYTLEFMGYVGHGVS
jgi:hypothetical protein